ncbi:MAG: heavy metal-associated domain-containing protein [Myxococcota bacterium]
MRSRSLVLVLLGALLAGSGCTRSTKARAGASLNSPEVVRRLELAIEGMHCAGCTQVITEELVALDGVVAAEVTLETGRAIVGLSTSPPSTERLLEVVYELGYEAKLLETADPAQ